ncbi:hypothetical protein C8Q76DRAFT_263885 [Earliella scabrosa]|nr:hypothetical protein C8Q76DRAFT_263885 [Earliella scabrosa]
MSALIPPPLVQQMAFDDDDGMPPLVDNPLPPMTFTFTTQLPPLGYSIDGANDDGPPELVAPEMAMDSPPGTPMFGPTRASHAKRRDASYIPRPPNAFILFRSSFIRAQHIPGEIEGNHSALSKIIGKCWKALPREERAEWEQKAIVALAEHRRKYPDWRFKPAANALAKVKDGPRKRGNRKGRGQSEKEERSREKRCAKIADFIVAGKTGLDLAAAVEEYDCEVGRGRKPKDEGTVMGVPQVQSQTRDAGNATADVKVQPVEGPRSEHTTPSLTLAIECADVKSVSPRSATDGRFKVPLTAMFKRSSSAPAPRARTPGELQNVAVPRRDSFSAAPPSYARASSFDSSGGLRGDIAGTVFDSSASREGTGHAHDSVSSIQPFSPGVAAPLILPRTADGGIGVNDLDGSGDAFGFAPSAFSSPPLPALQPDGDALGSPATSPVATPVAYGWGQESADIGTPTSISDMMGEAYAPAPSPSSYSSLEGWAGSPLPKQASPISSPLAKVCHYVDGPGSPSVMADAFDAAACALYGDWNEPAGIDIVGALGPAHSQYDAWGSDHAFSAFVFPAVHCRQDDF